MSEMYEGGERPYGFTYNHNGAFRFVIDTISNIIKLLRTIGGPLLAPEVTTPKLDNQFIERQNAESRLMRNYENDRIFPLDTVEIQKFRQEHNEGIETAIVHTGAFADELARSYNAFAVTIAADIFFRNGAYHPEQEEGRQVLAHEMTHIAQYEKGRIRRNSDLNELEGEAEAAEEKERYNPDTRMTIELNGKLFTFPRARMKEYAARVSDKLRGWIESAGNAAGEYEHFKLLCAYRDWIAGDS
jgi:hypothetical protein